MTRKTEKKKLNRIKVNIWQSGMVKHQIIQSWKENQLYRKIWNIIQTRTETKRKTKKNRFKNRVEGIGSTYNH